MKVAAGLILLIASFMSVNVIEVAFQVSLV
jgi:hypothetical protein